MCLRLLYGHLATSLPQVIEQEIERQSLPRIIKFETAVQVISLVVQGFARRMPPSIFRRVLWPEWRWICRISRWTLSQSRGVRVRTSDGLMAIDIGILLEHIVLLAQSRLHVVLGRCGKI